MLLALAEAGCGGEKTVVVEHSTTVVKAVPQLASTLAKSRTPHAADRRVSLASYQASLYSASIPATWNTEEDEAQKSGFLESKWRNPADPTTSVLIDVVEGETASPKAKAIAVRAATSRTAGYRELSLGPATVGGRSAWKWVFQVSGDQRVDYFVNECGVGVAILGSTIPEGYARWARTFRQVAASVTPDCSSSGSTGSPAGSSTPDSGTGTADFCATHPCIDNFDNGTGYVVQCADGEWSHSGGRPGACSYHGGETGRTYP
jgi:hypothetical protein